MGNGNVNGNGKIYTAVDDDDGNDHERVVERVHLRRAVNDPQGSYGFQ